MLIMFKIRDGMLSPEVAAGLAQKSFLWDLCQEWRIVPVGGELPEMEIQDPPEEDGDTSAD